MTWPTGRARFRTSLAAALPLAGLTAWQALHDHAGLRPDDEVLVHGGAGAVGGFAVQLAAQAGAIVTATVRGTDDALIARRLGARRVIDVNGTAFDTRPARYDVVLDTVGGETLERSYPLLRPGRPVGDLGSAAVRRAGCALSGHRDVFHRHAGPETSSLELAELVDCGALQVTIAATFPLADGRAAFESGTTSATSGRKNGAHRAGVAR